MLEIKKKPNMTKPVLLQSGHQSTCCIVQFLLLNQFNCFFFKFDSECVYTSARQDSWISKEATCHVPWFLHLKWWFKPSLYNFTRDHLSTTNFNWRWIVFFYRYFCRWTWMWLDQTVKLYHRYLSLEVLTLNVNHTAKDWYHRDGRATGEQRALSWEKMKV